MGSAAIASGAMMSLLFIVVTLTLLITVTSVKIEKLVVPSPVIEGSDVTLQCIFNHTVSDVYVIKWYKNDEEFYRYIPKNGIGKTDILTFRTEGIKLDLTRSNEGTVHLQEISLRSNGTYKCEASGHAPTFKTKSKHKKMVVYAIPKTPPKISGLKRKYKPNEVMNLNCTSAPSYPIAEIAWFLNGKPAEKFMSKSYKLLYQHPLYVAKKTLKLRAEKHLFGEDNKLHIRCESMIDTFQNFSKMHSTKMELHTYSRNPTKGESVAYSTLDNSNTSSAIHSNIISIVFVLWLLHLLMA